MPDASHDAADLAATSQELTEPLHPVTLPQRHDALPSGPHARPEQQTLQKRELIGRGGMGLVHAARDPVLRREVALKVMRRNTSRTAERRFVTEAQVTAQLEHPNIVPIYACDLAREPMSYSMKLVHGATLTELVERSAVARRGDGPVPDELSLDTLLDHLARVCDALAYAHEKGVVHRDLKPDNIMVGAHGQVYVMDWGLARVRDADDILDLPTMKEMTLPGYAIGSVGYMAPEQAQGHPMGPACDQYALGLILFQMLGGRRPRPRPDDLEAALARAASGELRPLQPLPGEHLSPSLLQVLERSTARAPEDRFPSVHAFARALRAARTEGGGAPVRSGWWLGLLAALLAFVLGGGLATTLLGGAGVVALGLTGDAPTAPPVLPVTPGPRPEALERAAAVQGRRGAVEAATLQLASIAQAGLQHAEPATGRVLHAPSSFAESTSRPDDTGPSAAHGREVSLTWPDVFIASTAARDQAVLQARRLVALRAQLAHPLGRGALWAQVMTDDGLLVTLPGSHWEATSVDPRELPWARRAAEGPTWSIGAADHHGRGGLLICAVRWPAQGGRPGGAAAVFLDPSLLVDGHPGQLLGPNGEAVAGEPSGAPAVPLPGGWQWRDGS